jgi:L-2-hydroxyglutarate oxidase LhgO
VYPVPEAAGLGIHATIDLGGQARFGPDVQWVEGPGDLAVSTQNEPAFYTAVRMLLGVIVDSRSESPPSYCR